MRSVGMLEASLLRERQVVKECHPGAFRGSARVPAATAIRNEHHRRVIRNAFACTRASVAWSGTNLKLTCGKKLSEMFFTT